MKLVKAAYIVAFAASALMVVSAVMDEIVLLPFAAVPLMAGIGIARRRVWSAYGYALFQCVGLLAVALLLLRVSGVNVMPLAQTMVAAVFGIAQSVLFFLAGRSLQAAGCKRGMASPWIAVSAVCYLPMIFVQAFVIPSAGMEDTLLNGDHVLVQRLPRVRPSRGDIIAFRYPPNRREDYVKRVIGVPGDRLRISNKVVYRNGPPLQEAYAVHKTTYVDPYRDNFPSEPNTSLPSQAIEMLEKQVVNGEVVVPERNYFVLGDNRDDSLDSRYWGFVPADDVLGKPLLIYDSQDRPMDLDGKSSGPHRTRWNRLFKVLSQDRPMDLEVRPSGPHRTRWSRIFEVL